MTTTSSTKNKDSAFVRGYKIMAITMVGVFSILAVFGAIGGGRDSSASTGTTRISFEPALKSTEFVNTETYTTNMVLNAEGTTGISAGDITFNVEGKGVITAIGKPVFTGCDASVEVVLTTMSDAKSKKPRIAFVVKQNTNGLPKRLTVPVTYKGTGVGTVNIAIDYSEKSANPKRYVSEVVGNVGSPTDATYGLALNSGSFEFTAAPIVCATDVKTCPDGSSVSRDVANNCQFKACPIITPNPTCNQDTCANCNDGVSCKNNTGKCQNKVCVNNPPVCNPITCSNCDNGVICNNGAGKCNNNKCVNNPISSSSSSNNSESPTPTPTNTPTPTPTAVPPNPTCNQTTCSNCNNGVSCKNDTGKCNNNVCVNNPISSSSSSSQPPVVGGKGLKLNLKVALQGVVNTIARDSSSGTGTRLNPLDSVRTKVLPFSVTLAGSGSKVYTQENINLTLDTNTGTWNGTVEYPEALAGAGYRVYVKGAKHLQRELCTTSGSDSNNQQNPDVYRCKAGESLTLAQGNNELDFSKVIIFSGDLKIGSGQDGIIKATDIAYILNILGTVGSDNDRSTDPSVLAIADLNLDGKVTIADFALMVSSLGVRYDDSIKSF
jgi:hypothetical protein